MKDTYIDMVKRHWPGISDEDAERILWETTCFGVGGSAEVEQQIIEAYNTSGGNVEQAIKNAYAEMDRAMEQYKIWEALRQ